jgi:TM2 domain-containing membrane protein YozV
LSDPLNQGPYQPTQPPGGPPPPAPGAALPASFPPGAPTYPGAYAAPPPTAGKSRVAAIVLALFLGWLGIHKFYLGKVALGVIYLIFFWTGIPGFIAWIEAILYLLKSDEAWALEYGGPVERTSGVAIGCLWLLALLPLLSIIAFVGLTTLVFLGSQVSGTVTPVGG